MNADDQMSETFNASLDAAYEKALPFINERLAAYQRDVASGELDDDSTTRMSNEPNQGSELKAEPESTVDPHLSIEEQSRQRWDLEPATRVEFRDNYKAYLAYEMAVANGQVLFREASQPTGTHTQQVAEMLKSTAAPGPVGGVAEQPHENGLPAPDAKE